VKNRGAARGFFITGTGTDVGKTFVSRILVQTFSKRMNVSYMKPVQTGCLRLKRREQLVAPDFEYVKKHTDLVTGDQDLHVPYRFALACSPHLAARMAHEKISLKKIKDGLSGIMGLFGASPGCVLVEGAGGVLVPLNESESMVHLIALLDLPVILVTTSGLGTLNHTFLSICALQSCGARIAGVVMNSPQKIPEDFIYKDNRETIRSFVRPVPFLEIKYNAQTSPRTLEFCNELAKRYL
jgi:dethiobiotin synthetase